MYITDTRIKQRILLKHKYLSYVYGGSKRFVKINSSDSWRKKKTFSNLYLKNFLSVSLTNRFKVFIVQRFNNISSPFKLSHYSGIKTKHTNTDHNFELMRFYMILMYKNFLFYVPMMFNCNRNSYIYFNKNQSNFDIYNTPIFSVDLNLLIAVRSWFCRVFKNSSFYTFLKLKYKGKNYRWHRKKKGIVLRFGHSHLIYVKRPKPVLLKKKGKLKILFFGTNIHIIRSFLNNLIKWKPSNVYTGRGLRLSRQRLLKKAGKVSIYR